MLRTCTTTLIVALATGCATESPTASISEQRVALLLDTASTGCALTLIAGAYVACLRSTYASRCAADLGDGPWCLGDQALNDLSDADIIAELGLAPPDSGGPLDDDLDP